MRSCKSSSYLYVREAGNEIGGPAGLAVRQPSSEKIVETVFGYDLCDRSLVRLCRSGAQCERHVRQAELEKPVAASRLTVIVALRRCPREDLDLPVVEPEAAIQAGALRLVGAFVGMEKPGLQTLVY